MEEMSQQLFKALFSEAGLVSALLFVSNIIWIGLYFLERKDRRLAWKANNDFKDYIADVIGSVIPILEVIKDRTDRN